MLGPRTCMTWVTPSLENKGEVEGRGTTTAFPGRRDLACSLVAASRAGPAALKIAALTPPPPGFSRLHRNIFHLNFLTGK